MLIRRGTLLDGRVADIRVGEVIEEVAPTLTPHPDEPVFDAHSGAVFPGLHDHHLHLRAAAAALDSVAVGPRFTQVIASAEPDPDGWIRAIGYHESVAGELDRARLDAVRADVPLRVQHRSGVLWILNSAALARIDCADHPDGRIPSTDPRLDAIPRRKPDLSALARQLVAYGVTGVTDATPELNPADVSDLTTAFTQRVRCLAPGKKILHDDQLDLGGLTEWIADRHANDVPVAIHCVTAAQLVVTIAALRAAGRRHPLDRIEHAAIVPAGCVRELAELGVTVVTQPNFVAERGQQYRQDVPADEQEQLWRIASLTQAGIPLAGSTDAPFGALDPWAAMRAAVTRATPGGHVLGPRERVEPLQALQMFLGSADCPAQPRRVAAGQPGDLCILSLPPTDALRALASDMVLATVVAGALV